MLRDGSPAAPRCTRRPLVGLAAAVAAVALAGCAPANFKPVGDFGNGALALADRYRPMVRAIVDTCIEERVYRALEEPGAYDVATVRTTATSDCRPLAQSAATANRFADALSSYATSLVTLAKEKPNILSDDVGRVARAAGGLSGRDGDAFFTGTQVTAARTLAETATDVLMERKTATLTRDLLDRNQQPLSTTVDAMKFFVVDVYGGELKETRGIVGGVLDRLRAASDTAVVGRGTPVPVRLAQRQVESDVRALDDEAADVRRFAAAADALVAAHADLVAKFDSLDKTAKVTSVSEFVDRVRALHEMIGEP